MRCVRRPHWLKASQLQHYLFQARVARACFQRRQQRLAVEHIAVRVREVRPQRHRSSLRWNAPQSSISVLLTWVCALEHVRHWAYKCAIHPDLRETAVADAGCEAALRCDRAMISPAAEPAAAARCPAAHPGWPRKTAAFAPRHPTLPRSGEAVEECHTAQ